jgi:hypothetical protein
MQPEKPKWMVNAPNNSLEPTALRAAAQLGAVSRPEE